MFNTLIAVVAEFTANIVTPMIESKIGSKKALFYFFLLSGISSIILIFFNSATVILLALMSAKFGISCAFCVIYLATSKVFPTQFTATAYGISNIFARIVTSLAPLIAEMAPPVPMASFTFFCILVLFTVGFLKFREDGEKVKET